MRAADLVPSRIYLLDTCKFAEFSRIGATGVAIFHPPGEPDMQSSFAVYPMLVKREATADEAAMAKGELAFPQDAPSCKACDGLMVAWMEAGVDGPERTGWAMGVGESYGATVYTNVVYCPWCGRKLPDLSEGSKPDA